MMVEVAHHPRGFTLFERPADNGNGWLSLKLVASERRKKRNWWFGWNGKRFSKTKDTKLLQEHELEIYEWVLAALAVRTAAHLHTHRPS